MLKWKEREKNGKTHAKMERERRMDLKTHAKMERDR